MKNQHIYTRNIEPLKIGVRLPNIGIYNKNEEKVDLHTIKRKKVYISVPSFANRPIMNEISKLDIILKDYPDFDYYIVSNESVFTQNRLLRQYRFKTFTNLSDFKEMNFARYTGTFIYEIEQLVKAIFITSEDDTLLFVKYYDDLYSNIDLNEITNIIKKN